MLSYKTKSASQACAATIHQRSYYCAALLGARLPNALKLIILARIRIIAPSFFMIAVIVAQRRVLVKRTTVFGKSGNISTYYTMLQHFLPYKSFVFPMFQKSIFLQKSTFPNILQKVINTIHRFFHRFCLVIPRRNSPYSGITCVYATFYCFLHRFS